MKRRKYIATLGVLASGTAAAMGTGAFTSASADRDVTVNVADDSSGYLGLDSSSGPNGQFASVDGSTGEIGLDFSGSGNGGSGVGTDSTYKFDNVFVVTNQGTQTIYVWTTFSGGSNFDDDNFYFYPNGARGTELNDGEPTGSASDGNEVLRLGPGESANIGVHINTDAITSNDTLTATFHADVDEGPSDGATSVDDEGDDFVVVDKSGGGDYTTIQSAVNNVSGSTIVVRPGTYDESVTIDVDGLTLEAIDNTKPTIEQGVDINASGVTVDGFEIQNPGTQGSADPSKPGGRVGVHVNSGNEDVSVLNNDITRVGTDDDDANPIGVLASDGTSGITVEGNEISNLEGTDEDQAQVQGVLINESGTQITGATVNNNTITDLLDTRSTNAIRFNGDVKGEIIGNTISDLNTEGDIPGTNDPGGFTQVIALQQGGGSSTGPSGVTIQGNDISNIETTTPGNFAPPVHLIVGSSASNVTLGGTSPSEENSFSADSPDVEIFVQDNGNTLNLSDVQSQNSFAPSAQVGPDGDRIFPGDLTLVTDSDDLQTQIDNANSGDTLAVASGTFDAVTIDKSLSLKSIFARPTVEAGSGTGRIEVSAPDVEISGFDIDLSDGEVVYVNPGEGLTFRNNVVDVSSTSNHGIRIDDSFGGPTVVEGNVFNIPATDASVNSQGILFSGGEDYLIKNNIINGPGKNADSPDDANAGILASVQADTTDADIEDNEISAFDQGMLLFENPPSANLDNFSITDNNISDADTGILAVELSGDGDTFSDINGESATSAQKQALDSDNTFTGSVDTNVDVQADS